MEEIYPEKFDTSNLDEEQKNILIDFFAKRKQFDTYLSIRRINLYTCPGCGYPTLTNRGGYEICLVCNWEDDDQDDDHANEIWGGPNADLSLTENRLYIGKVLNQIAQSKNGKIIIDAAQVLSILRQHDTIVDRILKELPENIKIDNGFEKQYELAKLNY